MSITIMSPCERIVTTLHPFTPSPNIQLSRIDARPDSSTHKTSWALSTVTFSPGSKTPQQPACSRLGDAAAPGAGVKSAPRIGEKNIRKAKKMRGIMQVLQKQLRLTVAIRPLENRDDSSMILAEYL